MGIFSPPFPSSLLPALQLIQAVVKALFGHQFLMPSFFSYSPFVQDDDSIGILDG